jgi:hypothetical protein
MEVHICYIYMAISLRIHCRIISCKKKTYNFFLKNIFLILMAFFMIVKWWKFTTKKSITLLIFILNFQKNWIRFIVISKIRLKSLKINLMFKIFMCLMLHLLRLHLNFYSLEGTFFLSNL